MSGNKSHAWVPGQRLVARRVGEMLPIVGSGSERVAARDPNRLVDVTCWCERAVVRVPLSDVCAGSTGSCGRWWCCAPT